MEVVLVKDVDHLGTAGKQIRVKNGYARNFLFPQKLAVPATAGTLKLVQDQKKAEELGQVKEKKRLEKLAGDLRKISITIPMKVVEDDKLYGSVTAQQIADLLAKEGFQIDKNIVVLDEPIKALGVYMIPIKLGLDVEEKVKLWVVKE